MLFVTMMAFGIRYDVWLAPLEMYPLAPTLEPPPTPPLKGPNAGGALVCPYTKTPFVLPLALTLRLSFRNTNCADVRELPNNSANRTIRMQVAVFISDPPG